MKIWTPPPKIPSSASFHTNIDGRVKISFVAKYDTSSVLEDEQNYIQVGDKQLLTAKRSLEKEDEERSSLLNYLFHL